MRLLVPILTRLMAALAALALVAAGVVVCVEVVANIVADGFVILPGDWPDRLRSTSFGDPVVTAVAAGVTAAGVLLLLVALWRRPPLTVRTDLPGLRYERHALERALADRLDAVDGVTAARVRASRRRLRVRVDTRRRLQPETVRVAAREVTSEFGEQHHLRMKNRVGLRRRRD